MRGAALVLVGLALLGSGSAAGHGRSTSTSSWKLSAEGARVVLRVQLADLQRSLPRLAGVTVERLVAEPELRAEAAGYLVGHLRLWRAGRPCSVPEAPAVAPAADPSHLSFVWRIACPPLSGELQMRIDPFLEALPSHLHLARFEGLPGGVVERVFVLDAESFALAAGDASQHAGSGLLDYLRLGVAHIATGFDHLLFLLALLLVGASLAEVATLVTGFTVAHSVTLAAGVLGWLAPRPAAVEALIGLSIAVVALENYALTAGRPTRRLVVGLLAVGLAGATAAALAGVVEVPAAALAGIGLFSLSYLGLLARARRPARLRWFVAFVFGLIHGFGFAGLLQEIGLPPDRVLPALLGFNLGVELGQLALVALAWPLLRWLLRGPRRALWAQVGSVPVLAAGLFWFLERSLG